MSGAANTIAESCYHVRFLDLLRRQRELDERMMGGVK